LQAAAIDPRQSGDFTTTARMAGPDSPPHPPHSRVGMWKPAGNTAVARAG